MSHLLPSIKRWARVSWAYVIGAALTIGMVLWWLLRMRRSAQPEPLPRPMGQLAREQARAEVRDRVAAANAEAAVEITAANAKSDALTDELKAIKADPLAARRRRRIIEMAERVAAESPP